MGGVVSAVMKPVSSIIGSITGANEAQDAANESAAQQRAAAERASQLAMFRPIGITSRLGSSTFGFDSSGKLSSGSYSLSPELKAAQDYVFSQLPGSQTDTSQLLGLGRSYLADSPEAVAARYMTEQRGLLQPSRETQLNQIRSNLQRSGRGGLSVGAGTGRLAANPELAAYYNALAQQDLTLSAGADAAAQQRIGFGQGLLSSAYSPLQTNLGMIGSIEQLGQDPFKLGLQAGGAAQTGSTAASQLLGQGLTGAAQTQYAGAQQKAASQAQFISSLIGSASGGMSGGGGSGGWSNFFNTNSTNSPFFNRGTYQAGQISDDF